MQAPWIQVSFARTISTLLHFLELNMTMMHLLHHSVNFLSERPVSFEHTLRRCLSDIVLPPDVNSWDWWGWMNCCWKKIAAPSNRKRRFFWIEQVVVPFPSHHGSFFPPEFRICRENEQGDDEATRTVNCVGTESIFPSVEWPLVVSVESTSLPLLNSPFHSIDKWHVWLAGKTILIFGSLVTRNRISEWEYKRNMGG